MTVKLLFSTPLWLAANAIRMSHDNHDKGDSQRYDDLYSDNREWIETGPKDKALIDRVGNKLKHQSVLEQLVYTFEIDGISRACLQELVRHRTARLTVKSSRYTLNELKHEGSFYNTDTSLDATFRWDVVEKYCVLTSNSAVNFAIAKALSNLQQLIEDGVSNDIAKFALPEAFKTKLQWQMDGRNLQSFLKLRLAKDALWEIRLLAQAIKLALPEEHQYLFEFDVI